MSRSQVLVATEVQPRERLTRVRLPQSQLCLCWFLQADVVVTIWLVRRGLNRRKCQIPARELRPIERQRLDIAILECGVDLPGCGEKVPNFDRATYMAHRSVAQTGQNSAPM